MRPFAHRTLLSALLSVVSVAGVARTAEPFDPDGRARLIAPLLDELALAVVHVDLTRVSVKSLMEKVAELIPEVEPEAVAEAAGADLVLDAFRRAGGREVYFIVTVAGPLDDDNLVFAAVPLSDGADLETLTATLRQFDRRTFAESKRFGNMLCVGSRQTIERLQALEPDPRPELAAAFRAAGDTTAQALLLPPGHTRRVVEEMMPELPEEFGGGPSSVVTRGLLWAAVGIDGAPQTSLRIVIQSEDGSAATALCERWQRLLRMVGGMKDVQQFFPQFGELAKALTPKVQGNHLVLELNERNGGVPAVISTVKVPIVRARAAARRSMTLNNLKQIGVAMHAYHEQHEGLPCPANYDADGKPLLSWRVHLLPHLGQKTLYGQFHLDEPWDSPHNRTLIERMPYVYRSPESMSPKKGITSFLLPVGEATVFPGQRGVAFSEISDGPHRTILVLLADDEHATVWTKPADLPFDPKQPLAGLSGPFEREVLAAFCDGSVRPLRRPLDADRMRALFTRNGGDDAEER